MSDSFGANFLCRLAYGTGRHGDSGKRKTAAQLLRFSLFNPDILRLFEWFGELGLRQKRPFPRSHIDNPAHRPPPSHAWLTQCPLVVDVSL